MASEISAAAARTDSKRIESVLIRFTPVKRPARHPACFLDAYMLRRNNVFNRKEQ
jgi:hypothetical protein